jgi:hypothetical protein
MTKYRLRLYKSVLFNNICHLIHSMLLNHHRLVSYVVLALSTYVRGFVSETTNQCSTQVVDLAPGQEHNLTIPCAKYVSADLQFPNGTVTLLSPGAIECASTATQTDLQLYLSDSAPQGSLNLTIFCLSAAPVCYSFNVEAPNQSTQKHDYSLRQVCSLNNATTGTNSSLLGQPQAMPPNKQDSGLAAGSSGSLTASSGQPVNPGAPVGANPTDSGSQPLSQGMPAGATPTGSSLSAGSSGQGTQSASAVLGGGASPTTTAPPGNGQAMAPSSGSLQSAIAGGPSGPASSSPQSTCLCPT